jgi:magnesium transporter
LKIYIQEEEEIEEIEISSRFIETEDTLVANANFLLDTYDKEPVSFILKNGILVSVRDAKLKTFDDTVKKMFANPRNYPTGYHIFIALLETRVEYDADMIEDATNEITKLSKTLTLAEDIDEDVLLDIKNL